MDLENQNPSAKSNELDITVDEKELCDGKSQQDDLYADCYSLNLPCGNALHLYMDIEEDELIAINEAVNEKDICNEDARKLTITSSSEVLDEMPLAMRIENRKNLASPVKEKEIYNESQEELLIVSSSEGNDAHSLTDSENPNIPIAESNELDASSEDVLTLVVHDDSRKVSATKKGKGIKKLSPWNIDFVAESSTVFCTGSCETSITIQEVNGHPNCDYCRIPFIYVCNICQTKCDNLHVIYSHLRRYCKRMTEIYKCTKCSFLTRFKNKLRDHNYRVHTDRKCGHCGQIFKTKSSFVTHQQYVKYFELDEETRTYHCKLCNIKFYNYAALWSHRGFCTKGVYCEVCCFTTTSKKRLKIHMKKTHMSVEVSSL